MEIDPVLIAIQFQIAILALAVPVLLTVIVNLDKRYKSNYLAKQFKSETVLWYFILSLLITLGFVLTYLTGVYFFDKEDWIIGLQSFLEGGILVSAFTQLISLGCLIIVVSKYYVPESLVNKLLNQHDGDNDIEKCMLDLMLIFIEENNFYLYKKIRNKYLDIGHAKYQIGNQNEIIYDDSYYKLYAKVSLKIIACGHQEFRSEERDVVAGLNLLCPSIEHRVSAETINFIWLNALCAAMNDKIAILVDIKKNIMQYQKVRQVNSFEKERLRRFFVFLIAYLFATKKYETIKILIKEELSGNISNHVMYNDPVDVIALWNNMHYPGSFVDEMIESHSMIDFTYGYDDFLLRKGVQSVVVLLFMKLFYFYKTSDISDNYKILHRPCKSKIANSEIRDIIERNMSDKSYFDTIYSIFPFENTHGLKDFIEQYLSEELKNVNYSYKHQIWR